MKNWKKKEVESESTCYADILLNGNKITKLKIDSGANVSVIWNELGKQLKVKLKSTNKILFKAEKEPLEVTEITEVILWRATQKN